MMRAHSSARLVPTVRGKLCLYHGPHGSIPYYTPYHTNLHDTAAARLVERDAQRRTPSKHMQVRCMWGLSRGRKLAYSLPPTEVWLPHVDPTNLREALNSFPDLCRFFMVRIRSLPNTN